MNFPEHKGELSLIHNEHRSLYETAAQWLANQESFGPMDWVSDEERTKAIETDSIWVIQWYPETPVGFYRRAASDLDVLLNDVNRA